jgi:hypothetical protein
LRTLGEIHDEQHVQELPDHEIPVGATSDTPPPDDTEPVTVVIKDAAVLEKLYE